MKLNGLKITGVLILAAVLAYFLTIAGGEKWKGVDETVVEKYAIAAGHPPRDAYINTDRGDMLLFFFLIAGTCGGFLAGYSYREIFSGSQVTESAVLKCKIQ